MTIDKITSAPSPNEQIKKINEIIDTIPTVNNATITITQGGVTKGSFTTDQSNDATIALDGGSGGSTDVRINGTSITSDNVADIKTNGVYNESTNKIATMHDLSGKANDNSVVHLTGDETISGTKTFTQGTKYQIGSTNKYGNVGASALGFNVSAPSDIDLVLGGSNLDFWVGNLGYRLLIGSTGLIPDARLSTNIARTSQIPIIPTNVSAFTNDSGYITGINSSDITTALGYTPTSPANVDGQWNYTFTIIHSATALGEYTYYLNSTKGQEAGASSSNIFDILPDDDYKYELLIMAAGRTKATTASHINIATTAWANPLDTEHNLLAMRGDGSHSLYNNNSLVIPIDTDRKIQVAIINSKADLASVTIFGYRRIGTNL